jgi:hypothetical protein
MACGTVTTEGKPADGATGTVGIIGAGAGNGVGDGNGPGAPKPGCGAA